MKKKLFIILGGVLIALVLAFVLIFVFSGKSKPVDSDVPFELSGSWIVYQHGSDVVDNEIMVFDGSSVSDYRDGGSDPFITSSYTYDNGTLKAADISKEFSVKIISENNIVLVEPNTMEWKLIRVANADESVNDVSTSGLVGDYVVVSVAGQKRENEHLVFTETSMTDYRDGSEYLKSDYELSGHILSAKDIGRDYKVYINGDMLLFIDTIDNYVWELSKIK